MPNQKISELTTIVTVDNAVDLFPIVDTSANTTKKITPTALKSALALDNVNNTSDANKPVSTAQQDALNAKVTANAAITAGTAPKVTFDAKGLVTSGDSLDETDLPTGINANKIGTGVVSTTEFEYLNGVTSAIQTQIDAKQATLVSGTNIKTINSTSLLGSGDITISANPSGVSGAIQFSNGSAFASDATNLFWDDTNNRLGVGTNAPTSDVHILGKTNTDVRNFQIQNLANQGIFSVTNDGFAQIGDFSGQGYGANMAFLRPSGATRATTFNQGNQNLSIQNVNGSIIFQNTPVQIKGSGSTSATTSLLVQNSSGVTGLTVFDNGNVSVGGSSNSAYQLFGNGSWFNNGSIYSPQYYAVNIAPSAGGSTNLYANSNNFKIGTSATATASAVFEVDSTTKGFLPPRMTTTQKNAIASPATGLVVYDNTTNKLCCYNGSTWNDLF